MDRRSAAAEVEALTRLVAQQQAAIERLQARLDAVDPPSTRPVGAARSSGRSGGAPTEPSTTGRRELLRGAGLAAVGAAGTAGVLGALGATATPAAATEVVNDSLVVTGSSSPGTASRIGDGTEALTVWAGAQGVDLGAQAGNRVRFAAQTRWDSDDDHVDGTNLDINRPAAVFRQTGEDHKGAMIEFQQYLAAGTHTRGVATNAPGTTFSVPQAGNKRVAWILAHYDSPNPVDAVHQHLNFETCMGDLQTIVTRFQISWGEDVAMVSFPNSNVRVVQSDKVLSFGSGNQVRATYRASEGTLGFEGDPVTFGLGQLQVADSWVSPTWFARKTASEGRRDTAVLADDPELRVPLAAGATYTFQAFVAYRAHVDADLRVAWSVPSDATLRWTPSGAAMTTLGVVGPVKTSVHGTEPVNLGGAGTSSPMAMVATGTVRTTGAGALQLRWAQDRAHDATLTVERDSFLQLTRVL
jgi:hypothetical protein